LLRLPQLPAPSSFLTADNLPTDETSGFVTNAELSNMSRSLDQEIPTIIDIEASGFGSKSYPIEVGLAMADKTTHCFVIKPADQWTYWDESAESLHGISRQLLMQKGQPIEEVSSKLNQLLSGQLIYTDAWSYDLCWLGKLFDLAETPQTFRLESLRKLLTDKEAARWHPAKQAVITEFNLSRHRASSDAFILRETFLRIKQ